MISRDMYRFLKKVPRWPYNKSIEKVKGIPFMNKFLKLHLLMSAVQKDYVGSNGEGEKSGFYLTESGREAIEEYKRSVVSIQISKIALVLSILGFLMSLASFFGWSVK